MMLKHPLWSCYISSKSWSMLMALINLGLGVAIILGGTIYKVNYEILDTFNTYFACGIFIGILNFVAAAVMVAALVTGKHNLVLLYMFLEFIILFTLTIFTGISSVTPEISLIFFICFMACLFLWVRLCKLYDFYQELEQYNTGTVQAGATEIACNNSPSPLTAFPEKAVDTTVV